MGHLGFDKSDQWFYESFTLNKIKWNSFNCLYIILFNKFIYWWNYYKVNEVCKMKVPYLILFHYLWFISLKYIFIKSRTNTRGNGTKIFHWYWKTCLNLDFLTVDLQGEAQAFRWWIWLKPGIHTCYTIEWRKLWSFSFQHSSIGECQAY